MQRRNNVKQWLIMLLDPAGNAVRVVAEEGLFFSQPSADARAVELNEGDDPYTVCGYQYEVRAA